jgi:pimeloyl-ACP methyl ester carboxylesterase
VTRARLLAVLVAFSAAHCALIQWAAGPPPAPAEFHRAKTRDGWEIELRRYKPAGAPQGPPVLCLHGIVANAYNVDLDERHSLARFVASRGREGWAMSMRGQGASTRPDWFAGRSADYDVDTIAAQDLPAAVAHVRAVTGAAEVDLIAHSLGGIAYYAWLAQGANAGTGAPSAAPGGIRRAATLGSPVVFRWGGWGESLARPLTMVGAWLPALPLRDLALISLPIHGAWDGPIERALLSFDNVDPVVWRRFMAVGADGISGGVLKQAARWIAEGRIVSRDGSVDYLAALASARTPTLVVAGRGDNMAAVHMVRPAYERLGAEKAWLVAGRADGARADYGHMDLLLGENAAEEVWAPVLAFLNAPAGTPAGTR